MSEETARTREEERSPHIRHWAASGLAILSRPLPRPPLPSVCAFSTDVSNQQGAQGAGPDSRGIVLNAPQLAEVVGFDRDVRRDGFEALGDGAELLQGGEDDDDLRSSKWSAHGIRSDYVEGASKQEASAAHLGLRTQRLLELLQVVRLKHLDGDVLRDLEALAEATLCKKRAPTISNALTGRGS